MSMKVLIADDELLARKRLERLLQSIPNVELAGECQNGDEVLEAIRDQPIDVVLLDIQMPGLSGLDAMALWPAEGPYVIFCTAHPDHALAAFDAGALDYVLKPVEQARLQKALDRASSRDARARFSAEVASQRQSRDRAINRLPVETRNGVVLLDPAQISHASLDGELVTVFSGQGDYLTDCTLNELQARLPAERFERVHRRALLNLEHVTRLEPLDTGGYLARTHRGHAIEVSRQSARELRKRLGLR